MHTESIRDQIKKKPRQHFALYMCWAFSIGAVVTGQSWEPFIAAGFVITAIID